MQFDVLRPLELVFVKLNVSVFLKNTCVFAQHKTCACRCSNRYVSMNVEMIREHPEAVHVVYIHAEHKCVS